MPRVAAEIKRAVAALEEETKHPTTTRIDAEEVALLAQGGLLVIPRSASPAQIAQWWSSLSAADRQAMLHKDPTRIGNLNGIPAAARDQANRLALPIYRSRLEARRDAAQALLDDWHPTGRGVPAEIVEARRQITDIEARLADLDQVEETAGLPNRQLLVLDPSSGSQVHAAVANGDVDTAKNVAVFVPGFTTTVAGSLAGYDDDMRECGHWPMNSPILRATAAQSQRSRGSGMTHRRRATSSTRESRC